MDRECVLGLILLLLMVVIVFAKQCYNSYLDKNYYKISDGEYSYYTENYQYDSSSNTIKFIDIDGREIIVYGSAEIIEEFRRILKNRLMQTVILYSKTVRESQKAGLPLEAYFYEKVVPRTQTSWKIVNAYKSLANEIMEATSHENNV